MLEVWANKERLYDEVKNLPDGEVLKYIKKKTDKLAKQLKLKTAKKLKLA